MTGSHQRIYHIRASKAFSCAECGHVCGVHAIVCCNGVHDVLTYTLKTRVTSLCLICPCTFVIMLFCIKCNSIHIKVWRVMHWLYLNLRLFQIIPFTLIDKSFATYFSSQMAFNRRPNDLSIRVKGIIWKSLRVKYNQCITIHTLICTLLHFIQNSFITNKTWTGNMC